MNAHTPTVTPELKDQIDQLFNELERIYAEDPDNAPKEHVNMCTRFEDATGVPVYIAITCDNKGGLFVEPVFFANGRVLIQPQTQFTPIEMLTDKTRKVLKYLVRTEEISWSVPKEIDGLLWRLPYVHVETTTKDVVA
ncbi:hypothetical protein [Methanococcoides methylutens]|uniref:hypothetical protein n=1 Tax=Methanococcoides methylutens TaxID=2226 RepID=UPI00064F9F0C|nr:hypothetical protein [Methanococcoides methylutens]